MNQKNYKLTVPMEDGTNFIIDVSTPHYSIYLDRAMERLNHAHQLHETLHSLVKEMAPVALISRSEAYQQAEKLLVQLGDPLNMVNLQEKAPQRGD